MLLYDAISYNGSTKMNFNLNKLSFPMTCEITSSLKEKKCHFQSFKSLVPLFLTGGNEVVWSDFLGLSVNWQFQNHLVLNFKSTHRNPVNRQRKLFHGLNISWLFLPLPLILLELLVINNQFCSTIFMLMPLNTHHCLSTFKASFL